MRSQGIALLSQLISLAILQRVEREDSSVNQSGRPTNHLVVQCCSNGQKSSQMLKVMLSSTVMIVNQRHCLFVYITTPSKKASLHFMSSLRVNILHNVNELMLILPSSVCNQSELFITFQLNRKMKKSLPICIINSCIKYFDISD